MVLLYAANPGIGRHELKLCHATSGLFCKLVQRRHVPCFQHRKSTSVLCSAAGEWWVAIKILLIVWHTQAHRGGTTLNTLKFLKNWTTGILPPDPEGPQC